LSKDYEILTTTAENGLAVGERSETLADIGLHLIRVIVV